MFKVGISEGRIVRADAAEVVFHYRKVNSQRPRTMTLSPAEFLRRFPQHVLPRGFMKVRYFGFLSPSCSMPIEEVKGRIELAHGFEVSTQRAAAETAEPATPTGMVCLHCGGKLRWCSVVLPRPLGSRGLWQAKGAEKKLPGLPRMSECGYNLAPHSNENRPPSGAGSRQTHGDPDGNQQQELLAPVAVAGDASRNDERLVEGAGTGEYP